jgi:nitroreductase
LKHNEVIDLLLNRKSVRKYEETIPDVETIETIVRAGQQAPFASQLYSVVYQSGAKYAFQAPLWFLICADVHKLSLFMKRRGWTIVTNGVTLLLFALQDASYMAENMVIAAEGLGLGSCFLGESSISANRVRALIKKHHLPKGVLPMVELVMGYPAEDFPPRPRYPMDFTLFKDRYPDLTEEALTEAMSAMDEGYLAQGYYKKQNVKIKTPGREDTLTFDDYSWTEHISRKWGQWEPSPEKLLEVMKEQGFSFSKEEE